MSRRRSSVTVACAAATGLLGGIGFGLLVADGRTWPIVAVPLLALGLHGCVRLLVPPEDRSRVGAIVALGFALHIAMAVVLFTGALAAGRGGFITGDDAGYAQLARAFVAYLNADPDPVRVPPNWGGEAYLFGTWVYLESAVFYLIGYEPLAPILLNGALALVTALLAFDIARRLFDRGAAYVALALVAFFPSLVAWSSLNLKDSLALLLIAIVLWSLVRLQWGSHAWPLALAYAALVPMESLRQYIFVGLAVLIPLAVAMVPRLPVLARTRWTGAALVTSGLFLTLTQAGVGLGPQLLESFEGTRQGMAAGARTRFVDESRVVKHGDTFVVSFASPTRAASAPFASPTSTPSAPTPPPSVIHVEPGVRIVVATTSAVSPQPGTAVVRPGDIVVVGGPATTPAPEGARMVISATAPPLSTRSEGSAAANVTLRTLSYLPTGLAYALFAPFPWQLDRAVDFATVPDMLLWYVCLAAAAITLVQLRSRWQVLFTPAALAGGLLLVLALVEGNVGTLYRHRAMSIPWVLLLAAPTISRAYALLRRR